MAFGNKQTAGQISADRLAAVAGGGGAIASTYSEPSAAASSNATPRRRVSLEPDLSRIRKSSIDETPEARKKRLAAKTMNFGATILARLILMGAAGYYLWDVYQFSGQVPRGVALGLFAMVGDFGRVLIKAMEPGTK